MSDHNRQTAASLATATMLVLIAVLALVGLYSSLQGHSAASDERATVGASVGGAQVRDAK